jgi:hypothetical protein
MSEDCFNRLLVLGKDAQCVASFAASAIRPDGSIVGSGLTAGDGLQIHEDGPLVTFNSTTLGEERELCDRLPLQLPKKLTGSSFGLATICYFTHVALGSGPMSKESAREIASNGNVGPTESFREDFNRHPSLYFFCSMVVSEAGFALWEFWKGGRRLRYGFDVRRSFDDHLRFAGTVEAWSGYALAEPDTYDDDA